MPFSVVPLPFAPELFICPVNSADTNPIAIGTATPNKKVHLAGFWLSGGTTAIFQSNSTEISRITTTGLAVRMPESAEPGVMNYPILSSNAGEILNLVPAAAGMTGQLYYWIF